VNGATEADEMRGEAGEAGYGPDMSYAHHTGHSDFARIAAPAVLEHLGAAGIDGGLVVDLGCGTGILAGELLRSGYDVTGVDLSADMIRLARETAPCASFITGSYLDVELPTCAVVTSIGQSLGYAFDPRNGAGELSRLFRRVHDALRPGGLFVFDLNAPSAASADAHMPRCARRDTPDWTLIAEAVVDGPRAVLTRDITLFRRVGDLYRRTDERHVVLLHEPATVLAELTAAGFAARRLDGYGSSVFPPDLAGYLATKEGRRS
jgi:SAM-dependent methyltransferase